MLYYLLFSLHKHSTFLNVFRYITFRSICAFLTAFAVSLAIGPYIIRKLQRNNVGQRIREDGPTSHHNKSGIPTMGGIIILIAIIISVLLWANLKNRYIWITIFSVVGFGIIGFYDDYLKFIRNRSDGLAPRYKFGFQIIVAMIIGIVLYSMAAYSTKLNIPFFKNISPDIGLLYIPFIVLVLVGASNAVNLTDGLDGLAIGPIVIATITYMIVVYATGHKKFAEYLLITYTDGAGEIAIFCGAMIGASLGFLWFNAYPASVFMGDVGSLALGGALGTVAIISKHELLLPLVGGIFVIEALSVIFQVAYYKSRKKRIFLMAPIHHHFELKGWQEPKVVTRFWIIAIILALLSLSTLKLR